MEKVSLDDGQAAVVARVASLTGCTLVTGPPGTGKTTALIAAVTELVSRGLPLSEIVVLAHARPAAQRLRRQIISAIAKTQINFKIVTIHGWCQWLMGQYGTTNNQLTTRLLSAPEQEFRVRELLDSVEWPSQLGLASQLPVFAGQVRALLARTRQLGLDPADLALAGQSAGRPEWVAAAAFFEHYLDVIDAEGSLDYAELVHRSRLLMADPEVGQSLVAQTKAILVDDFAESDESVVALLRDLWRAGIPVTAFADESTQVFNFRGAWTAATKRFPTEFADSLGSAEVIALTNQWRSAEEVEIWTVDSPDDEIRLISQQLMAAHNQGLPWEAMAVIGHSDGLALARLAEDLSAHLPVRMEGEVMALADSPAIRVILAAIELLIAEVDGSASDWQWQQVLVSPLIGISQVDIDRTEISADLPERLESARGKVQGLVGKVASSSVAELVWGLWTLSDWPEQLRQAALAGGQASLRANRDLDAVIALFDLISAHPNWRGLSGLSNLVNLVGEQVVQRDRTRESDDPAGLVTVLSAFRAKGRSWPLVACVGAVEGQWPAKGSPHSLFEVERLIADGQAPAMTRAESVATERRLFRLATSRASQHLIITSAPSSDDEPMTQSRFVTDFSQPSKHWQPVQASQPLALPELVGQLRATATAADEAPGLVAGAISCLRRLKDAVGNDGQPLVPTANPDNWWRVGQYYDQPLAVNRGPACQLSASSIGLAIECPRAWFLSQRAGGSPPAGIKAAFGTISHRLFQASAEKDLTEAELESALATVWSQLPYQAVWQSVAGRTKLDQMMARFATWRDNRPNRRLLATEAAFSVMMDTANGEVEVKGRVDRLEVSADDELVVIDFKTDSEATVKKQTPQMALYQLAASRGVFHELAPDISKLALPELVWPCAPLKKSDVGCRVDPVVIDQEKTLDQLSQVVAMIKSQQYVAKSGSACRYCAFKAGCPAKINLDGGEDNG